MRQPETLDDIKDLAALSHDLAWLKFKKEIEPELDAKAVEDWQRGEER